MRLPARYFRYGNRFPFGVRFVPIYLLMLWLLLALACPVSAQRCYVFDDFYQHRAGPSAEIYISGNQGAKACIPDGTTNGTCRKWFGQCTTFAGMKVFFYVFDDSRNDTRRGPSDSVYIPPSGNQACIPDGSCRKWFGEAFSDRGILVTCSLSNDGESNPTVQTDAIYIPTPSPSPGVGSACMTDGTPTGGCRKWFGLCDTFPGEPITYNLSISSLTPATVVPGNSATATVTFSSFGGYTGNVTLQCIPSTLGLGNQPVSCNPKILNASQPTSTLTVTTTGAPNGLYSVAVTGADDNCEGYLCPGPGPSNGAQFVLLTVSNVVKGGGGFIALWTFLGLLALWCAASILRRKRQAV